MNKYIHRDRLDLTTGGIKVMNIEEVCHHIRSLQQGTESAAAKASSWMPLSRGRVSSTNAELSSPPYMQGGPHQKTNIFGGGVWSRLSISLSKSFEYNFESPNGERSIVT